jgi:hypothetical protein
MIFAPKAALRKNTHYSSVPPAKAVKKKAMIANRSPEFPRRTCASVAK